MSGEYCLNQINNNNFSVFFFFFPLSKNMSDKYAPNEMNYNYLCLVE